MNNLRFSIVPLALTLAAATLAVTGCGGGKSVAQPKPLTELVAPAYRMQVIWHRNAGEGGGEYESRFVPAVSSSVIYTANRDGEVGAFDLASGKRLWHVDTDKTLISGPSVIGNSLVVATRNGELMSLGIDHGQTEWDTSLASAVLSAPAGANGIVVARTVAGHIAALDLASGKRLWTTDSTVPNLTLRGTSSPVIDNGTVYVGLDNGKIEALDLVTGEQRWIQTVALPDGRSELDRIVDVDATPLLDGQTIYAASAGKAMVAMNRASGQIRWKQPVGSDSDLALGDSQVFATGLDGTVWGLNQQNGSTQWQTDALGYRQVSAPAFLDGNVLVGDYQGYLHWLSADDGHEMGRGHPFGEAIDAQPVVISGDRAVVLGAQGELALIRFVPNGR